ncbi:MAG: GHMP kinase [Sphaerochaetaceae bacterium]|nr:GHMP kinase [Sphaerochaetaceae bacterium]
MTCEERFIEIYNREPLTTFCPYRVCPLGAHIDHQFGKVHGFALNYGIHMAYGLKQNGIIEMQSMNFPKRVQFHVNSVPEEKEGDWGDYLRGAAKELGKKYKLSTGICGVIKGTLPSGGISSSAALTICFLRALSSANGINLTDSEFIYMAKRAENEYVGVSTGKLDQSCETLCRTGSMLSLDCKDDSYINYPAASWLAPFKIGIFFSGLQRSLSKSSAYNNRVDECKAAAFALYSFGVTDRLEGVDLEHGLKFRDMYLRFIPKELFNEFGDRLPSSWQKRARHFYTEMDRVEKGLDFWKKGDLVSYGKLISESGRSSIDNYECGSPELIKLYNILSSLDGVYGARFSGAGFKGCCMALINPEKEEKIKETVEREYLKEFPEMKGLYKAYMCETADGVGHAEEGRF